MPGMRNLSIILVSGLAAALLFGCGGKSSDTEAGTPPPEAAPPDAAVLPKCQTPVNGTKITMRKLAGKVSTGAMIATSPPNDKRLFVVEQRGAIRIFDETETLLTAPFIDLDDANGGPVLAGGEQGMLGLAFHPKYAENRTFFVYYTRRQAGDGTNPFRDAVARCTASTADPNKADPTCTEVLAIPDFASNHNGGMLEFGKDGFLYIGTGDGGSANDPNNNGQALVTTHNATTNQDALLAKLLRIDVDNKATGKEYGIPADNPFAAGGGEPEIFAYGLRNPWRWSFDRETGDLWIGDVGQGVIEEVDFVKAADIKGKNFGWSMYEGSNCFKPPCTATGKFMPQDERTHATGWNAVIGGQVYRGTCYPDIVGTYFYTDNGKGGMAKATANADGSLTVTDITATGAPGAGLPASLHESASGELYETDTAGNVYHLEAGP
jgi:glucose/arabinose dehydrogenase